MTASKSVCVAFTNTLDSVGRPPTDLLSVLQIVLHFYRPTEAITRRNRAIIVIVKHRSLTLTGSILSCFGRFSFVCPNETQFGTLELDSPQTIEMRRTL